MRRFRFRFVPVVIAILVVALALFFLRSHDPSPSDITPGMTAEEVTKLFGRKPDGGGWNISPAEDFSGPMSYWRVANGKVIVVDFNKAGRVVGVHEKGGGWARPHRRSPY